MWDLIKIMHVGTLLSIYKIVVLCSYVYWTTSDCQGINEAVDINGGHNRHFAPLSLRSQVIQSYQTKRISFLLKA